MARVETFGLTAEGREVDKFTLSGHRLSVSILSYGAILQSVRLAGIDHDLTLGSDRLADYEGAMAYHGSLIAPVVNRIRNARAEIAGQTYGFEANQDGQHCLHSGSTGSQHQIWRLIDKAADHVTLGLDLPDGMGGFPGNRALTARFSIVSSGTLRLDITARTDAPTLLNATNHSYWNLDGSDSWAGHQLQITADEYLPTGPDCLPLGAASPVADTPYDFRAARQITPENPPMDCCFCLSNGQTTLRPVLRLTGVSGVSLQVSTTEPGVQVYDGRNAIRPGHGAFEGIAIETQGWPDAPNQSTFPSVTLLPGEMLCQSTEWQFSHG